jgi:hypothetical protein
VADPNRVLFESVVRLLVPLLDELVFVGGCTTGLFITDPAAGSFSSCVRRAMLTVPSGPERLAEVWKPGLPKGARPYGSVGYPGTGRLALLACRGRSPMRREKRWSLGYAP